MEADTKEMQNILRKYYKQLYTKQIGQSGRNG